MSTSTPVPTSAGGSVPGQPNGLSDRSFIATWMFAWLLGFLGVDRFYLGKIFTGVLYLLTGGLLLLGVIYDYWTLNDQIDAIHSS